MIRWHVIITYRTDAGLNPVEHDVEELFEVDTLVEFGPHWDCVEKIEITRHGADRSLTVESAEKL